jgi:arsenate reductase
MAEGILRSFNPELEVFSAGTMHEKSINPYAVEVMKELGTDINNQYPKNVNDFVNGSFDYVITVCDNAKEVCPVFTGDVKNRLHMGFEDPADAKGTDEEKLIVYRKIRDEIAEAFRHFYDESISKSVS